MTPVLNAAAVSFQYCLGILASSPYTRPSLLISRLSCPYPSPPTFSLSSPRNRDQKVPFSGKQNSLFFYVFFVYLVEARVRANTQCTAKGAGDEGQEREGQNSGEQRH